MSITPVGYIEIRHGQSTFRPIREARQYVPLLVGAAALVILSVRLLDRQPGRWRTIWKAFRR
jgi:hypothetical protein